jgi:Tfp pilus assembly protein PilO
VKVTPREKRLIVAAIVLAVGIGIYYATTSLIPEPQSLSQDVEQKKRLLRRQRETLSSEGTYKARLEQYQKQLEAQKARFLPGENSSLASSELQRVVRDLADQSGVEITQRSPVPEKKVEDFVTKVGIRVDANCTPEQLVHFMASIESYDKLLKIDDMQISSIPSPRRGATSNLAYEIRPSLTISGFISAQEEKPKEKPAAKPVAAGVS